MSKSIKILSIVLIIFSLFINFYGVYASNINMNLTSNSNDTSLNQQANVDNQNQSQANVNNQNQSQVPTTEPTDDANSDQDVQDSIVPPTSVGSVEEDGLGSSNIISILLIAVGVVLILLAIAIIIRLK